METSTVEPCHLFWREWVLRVLGAGDFVAYRLDEDRPEDDHVEYRQQPVRSRNDLLME